MNEFLAIVCILSAFFIFGCLIAVYDFQKREYKFKTDHKLNREDK